MTADSTAPGYLAPLSPAPAEDIDLDALIQPAIVGITGMDDALVVIKGQPVPPEQPGRAITWCAFGVRDIDPQVNPDTVHIGYADQGLGVDRVFRQEEIEVIASFYGPAARAMASRLRDGFAVGQNRDALRASGLVYVRPERVTGIADLVNQQFVRRADFVFRLRRMVGRTYPIRNVDFLAGFTVADGGDVFFLETVLS